MEIKNFALIKGKDAIITDGRIKLDYKNELKSETNNKNSIPDNIAHAEIRSDQFFSNGEIELKFTRNSYNSGVLLLFSSNNDGFISAGLSYYEKAYVIATGLRDDGNLAIGGKTELYDLDKEHSLKITLYGSQLKLYINKVLICEATVNIKESPVMLRITSDKEIEVYDVKIKSIKPKVFVIMQFSKEYNELFEEVIRPVVETRGFECIRADEFYTSTPILKDIIDSITQSSIIVAEITPDNPNVFYEIGYSHAINKPTILLCDRKREKLPFDLSSFRTLFYENTIAGKKKIEENLKKYLDNII